MPQEHERRFTLKNPHWRPDGTPTRLEQGIFRTGPAVQACVGISGWLTLNGERLVRLPWLKALPLMVLCQAGQKSLPEKWKVRIRCYDTQRYVLDIKGPRQGTSRFELPETQLTPTWGRALLNRTPEADRQHKDRYQIRHQGQMWTVDIFSGKDADKNYAEAELPHAGARLALPDWVGEEITHRKVFGKAALAAAPAP